MHLGRYQPIRLTHLPTFEKRLVRASPLSSAGEHEDTGCDPVQTMRHSQFRHLELRTQLDDD